MHLHSQDAVLAVARSVAAGVDGGGVRVLGQVEAQHLRGQSAREWSERELHTRASKEYILVSFSDECNFLSKTHPK